MIQYIKKKLNVAQLMINSEGVEEHCFNRMFVQSGFLTLGMLFFSRAYDVFNYKKFSNYRIFAR